MKLVGIIIAVVCLFIAIYNFDLHDFNRSAVSVLLFLTALLTLVRNRKLNRFIRRTAVALTIFLVLKLILFG